MPNADAQAGKTTRQLGVGIKKPSDLEGFRESG
jgi:hypothetical protein